MRVRCAVHEGSGLQLILRTGDPDLPVVSVRIPEYGGSGAYRAEIFVTGRSRSGALAGSTGEASLEIDERQVQPAGDAEPRLALQGAFEGSYQGGAGKGSVQGRFRGCSFPGDDESARPAPAAGSTKVAR